ncbi:MAG TPA: glutamate-1-semialdehyde 2,1-aminomutase [Spirochaetota bacterium]|nr:glutamate-1-semialdehyde 2,1-aminomutase [Spirochaetota bacterium]HPV40655.1 glutamate-1-semialdehyde 2,1-aminomutase [Spirochaetota bacterium]
MNIEKSQKLQKKALRLMPGGVNSPVRAFKAVGGNPLFMKKGEGAHMVDEDGNDFIDYCMSWGPLILGHADRSVINAIRKTAKSGTSFGTSNKYEVLLAQYIVKRFKSIEMVRFVNSGTEAVMSAIRLARGFTGKEKIVKFDGCYHGHADQMLVAAGSGLATFGTPDSNGVTTGAARDTIVVPFNDLEAVSSVFEKEHGSIAAVILEPVPCNYGLILPGVNFLPQVRALCDRYGILLIFDEVITGFRLAPGGAQEYYGVKADITTLGKIIGGGLPVGAYGASRKIMRHVSPLGPVYQAGTLSGNPLAMTAGIQTLKKLEKINAYDELKRKGEKLDELLKPALDRHAGKVLFTRIESIFAFNFTREKSIDSLAGVKACDMGAFARFHGEMLGRGVYLAPSGYEVGFLSTAHTDADIEQTAAAVAASLDAIFQ